MAKYEVIKPWHGVKSGEIVDIETLHPSLKPHVRMIQGEVGGELSPATPAATAGRSRKPKQESEQ
ncbi:glycoprotein [Escherichia coli]